MSKVTKNSPFRQAYFQKLYIYKLDYLISWSKYYFEGDKVLINLNITVSQHRSFYTSQDI